MESGSEQWLVAGEREYELLRRKFGEDMDAIVKQLKGLADHIEELTSRRDRLYAIIMYKKSKRMREYVKSFEQPDNK